MTRTALRLRVRGVVQGVGFRPFVHRVALRWGVGGWVLNDSEGVDIHAEGDVEAVESFVRELTARPPPAARIDAVECREADSEGRPGFEILVSRAGERARTGIAPDLPVCSACLDEMSTPADRRSGYPYINCTDCGPRYSIVTSLPYDRSRTTMAEFPMCPRCAREYADVADRRFHAQPVACPECGPHFFLRTSDETTRGDGRAIAAAARSLREGRILAIKGIGGYHLACDARNGAAVRALRERKFRKERPFALMARDIDEAKQLVHLSAAARSLMTSAAAPIVLATADTDDWPDVAPDTIELGVMLPYAPLHHLLFGAGAPPVLVLTSGNRASEPIAYRDDDALRELAGIADAFLVGERPIARRVDDSVVRDGAFGPVVLRRSRGYSPGAVGRGWPAGRPVLALGGDLKNAVTVVVDGQAFVSQHIGDLEHLEVRAALAANCADLLDMYGVRREDLTVVHDRHPEYFSTAFAATWPGEKVAAQHHRAHIASVLVERGAWTESVIGIAADGTGYGDDGAIWGGEFFAGSLAGGLERAGRLRPARLPGGDGAALFPPQAAAGFLAEFDHLPDMLAAPFEFPARFTTALDLARRNVRSHTTTSIGRLFDAVAALCGFTREITYEGQAAMWLEQLARRAASNRTPGISFGWQGAELDFRPALDAVVEWRRRGRDPAEIARSFHGALAAALVGAAQDLASRRAASIVVLSGGVFQNALLLEEIRDRLPATPTVEVWINHEVPPNDGGISLGQAALAAAPRRG